MNVEETKKAIEVMQAFVDGKQIQFTLPSSGGWADVHSEPCWEWANNPNEYRIKPEPVECWACLAITGHVQAAYASEGEAHTHKRRFVDCSRVVRMVEAPE